MRNRFLVCYDVSDSKRLARTYKKMNGFGEPVPVLCIHLRPVIQRKGVAESRAYGGAEPEGGSGNDRRHWAFGRTGKRKCFLIGEWTCNIPEVRGSSVMPVDLESPTERSDGEALDLHLSQRINQKQASLSLNADWMVWAIGISASKMTRSHEERAEFKPK